MQHQRGQDLTNSALNNSTTTAMNQDNNINSNSNHNSIRSIGLDEEVDLDASLSRIGLLSESLSALTRKRPVDTGNHHSKWVKRRDSLASSRSNSNSSLGGHSFGMDDLVYNLEGLEFDLGSTGPPPCHQHEMSSSSRRGGGGLGDDNDSISSRLSAGLWSLQDVEPWACGTCTYENEPIFLACEMCGQSRPTRTAATVALGNGSVVAVGPVVDESVLSRQEQRLYEIQQLNKAPPSASEEDGAKRTASSQLRSTFKPPRGSYSRTRRCKSNDGLVTKRSGGGTRMKPGQTLVGNPVRRPSLELASLSGSSLSLLGHGHGSSGHVVVGESSLRDFIADQGNSLQKLKAFDLQGSAATATTCDISALSLDYSPAEQQRLGHPLHDSSTSKCPETKPSCPETKPTYPRSAEC